MPEFLYEKVVGDVSNLIDESLKISREYCSLSNSQRDEILQSNKNFYHIMIWDGRIIRVNPIKFIPDGSDEIGDVVWIDCNQDKFALEALLEQLLDGIKPLFATHSKNRNANDILQWQIQKSS